MKRKILTVILSITMAFSTTGYAFADVDLDNPPEEPTKPKVENYQDNDKIEKYNKEAEEYNKKADEYNAAVDKEYNDAVEEVNKKNVEGQQKQADSQKAHDEAVAANEKAQKEANEQNALIDEQNATGRAQAEESVTNHNNAIAENEEAQRYNAEVDRKYEEDLAQYATDKEKYDSDYEKYASSANQTDIKNKQTLENAGLTIEEYNMGPLKSPDTESWDYLLNNAVYRNEVREENTNLKDKEYTSTVSVEKSDNPSGVIFILRVEHIMIGGQTYSEEIEFDANDVVTVNSLAFSENCKPLYADKTYGAFYSYQGNSYLSKYWYESPIGYIMSPPVKDEYKDTDIQNIWNKGNQYIITYQHGKKYASDSNEIDVCYYYVSQTTCNIPLEEPIPPDEVQKGEYKAEVEVPDIILWEDIPYVSPILVNVPEVEVWENLPDPVKKEYLKRLILMSLFAVPSDDIDIIEPDDNIVDNNEVIDDKDTNNNIKKTARSINNTSAYILEENTETADIVKYSPLPTAATPLIAPEQTGTWAFINLLTVFINFILSIILLLMIYINNRKEDDETEVKNKILMRICTLIIAIISGIVFLLTEDMTLPMVLIDEWTPLMIIILVFNIIAAILSRRKIKEKEEIEKE